MDFYPKYLSKEKRLLHYILTLIIVLGAIFYNVLDYRFGAILTIDIGIFKFDFSYIFGIIIGGLLGDFWIMLVTVVVFICNCFYNLDSSYYTFIILLTAMITNKFMKSKATIKISSTIIYSMIASLICGNLWVGLLTIMGEMQTDSSLLSQIIVFLATFPEFLILYMGYYALCNYAPDKYKELFYMTHYYTEKSKANGGYVQTRLSKKVTTSLSILISIILISSLIMINRLFDNNILEADVYPIYIKLVLMIMCIAIPFISLYSFMMRMSTLYPIVRMSKYMQQFSNTTDETRGD
ncbi:MAG: hypothetical protein K6B41_06055, partial [Butyrivibrio sp.]|nr:hypothetical protein [Butyrivibrio sp.]